MGNRQQGVAMKRWKSIDTTTVCRRGMTMVELMV